MRRPGRSHGQSQRGPRKSYRTSVGPTGRHLLVVLDPMDSARLEERKRFRPSAAALCASVRSYTGTLGWARLHEGMRAIASSNCVQRSSIASQINLLHFRILYTRPAASGASAAGRTLSADSGA